MSWFFGLLLVAWVLLTLKKSRPDGTFVGVHPYRRLMFFIMPGRNESVVYFDREFRAEPLLAYLEKAKEAFGGNMTHATVAAINIGMGENPAMNQFIVGRRMYARKGRHITFSMKRQKLNKKAKLAVVKLGMKDGESFRELTERINGKINVERSGKRTRADKEFDLFNALPRPILWFADHAIYWLDYYGLLPFNAFVKDDAMHTSAVIANLGSLGMGPGYHHLYEYGTCPLFMMVGKIEEKPVIEDGKIVIGKVMHIRFSYDERIADGFTAHFGIESVARVLSDPDRWLGCIAADGSDTKPMWPHGESINVGE